MMVIMSYEAGDQLMGWYDVSDEDGLNFKGFWNTF
jgi:hypothetical protein